MTRPKVLMPEKTESACEAVSKGLSTVESVLLADLSTAITWQRVVPQRLVRALQWLLVRGMVAVSSHARGESGDGSNELEHLDLGGMKRRKATKVLVEVQKTLDKRFWKLLRN